MHDEMSSGVKPSPGVAFRSRCLNAMKHACTTARGTMPLDTHPHVNTCARTRHLVRVLVGARAQSQQAQHA
jgi:hypothetical protein